jgi:hypothetical protein
MESSRPSVDSYICHVADAPHHPQHKRSIVDDPYASVDGYRFPPPSENASRRYSSPRSNPGDSDDALPGTGNDGVDGRHRQTPQPYYVSSALRAQPLDGPVGGAATTVTAALKSNSVTAQHSIANMGGVASARTQHGGSGSADPFISESSTDVAVDEAPSPANSQGPTQEGVPITKPAKRTTTTTIDAEDPPRRLPQLQEDRVRGYSVMQESSAASSQSCLTAEAAAAERQRQLSHAEDTSSSASGKHPGEHLRSLPPVARTAQPRNDEARERAGVASAEQQEQRQQQRQANPSPPAGTVSAAEKASRGHRYTASDGSNDNALVRTGNHDTASLTDTTNSTREDSMKELVSHVERDSYGFDLREALHAIDFATVLDEYQQNRSVESKALQECRHLFRVLTKNKDALSAEDVYDLLVLFTPCGAAYREGVDFLLENCEGNSSLSFEDFLVYGPRLRARLRGYELFSQLRDHDKLIETHHRVLPGEPFVEANAARVRLLQLAEEQLRGTLQPRSRPLRLYEELFLVEYQEMLYEAALIPGGEVPQRVPNGDFAHELQQHRTLPQLSVPALKKESMDWRADGSLGDDGDDDDAFYAASSRAADKRPFVVAYSEDEPSNQVSPVHHGTSLSGRGQLQPLRPHGSVSGRGPPQSRKAASTARTANTCYSLYNASGSRTGRHGESLAVTLQGRPRTDMRKNLGRLLEEEYWERCTLDDHLIWQLQYMYNPH